MSRPFHPSELSDADGSGPTTAELAEALAVARDLEANLAAGDIHPSGAFVDRVMDAVALEPLPQPAIAAGTALRGGRLGAMAAALADSWRVAFSGGRPFAVRAQAAAFVLIVVVAMGSLGGITAIGAVRFLEAAPSRVASPPATLPTGPSTGPDRNRTGEPSDDSRAAPTAEPTDAAEPTDPEPPDETSKPTPTQKSGGGHEGRTPKPTETPEPKETEDHGGEGTPEPTEDTSPDH